MKPGERIRLRRTQEAATAAQRDKQTKRDSRGRYAESYRCERCNKNAGYDYYSEPRLTDGGIGICLCGKCAGILEKMNNEQLEADTGNWA